MQSIFCAARKAKKIRGPVDDAPPLQETQTWEAHGHLAEDPYYPSLESQIYHTIVKDYEPLGSVRPGWLA